MKHQKKIKLKFLLFLIFIFSLLFSQSDTKPSNQNYLSYQEKYEFDMIKDDGTCVINIKEINGDLIINGHLGSGVFLLANHLFNRKFFQENKKSINKNILSVFHNNQQINIENQSNIKSRFFSDYILNIPINTNLNISLSGGSINANQISGELKIFTSGGDIVSDKISGNIIMETNSGDIIIKKSDGEFRIHTNNGNIKLNKNKANFSVSSSSGDTFVNELIGDIELMNMAGSIYLNKLNKSNIICRLSYGNIFAKEIKGDFYGETKNGDISIESLDGFCNLISANGNILTQYMDGSVIIDVGKGSISGKEIYGPIQAFTSFGNINIGISFDYSISDYSVSLETSAGNIDIKIPKKLPISIVAEIPDKKNSGSITSDIPIIFKNNSETYASGNISGATIPIYLFSGKGHIVIREN